MVAARESTGSSVSFHVTIPACAPQHTDYTLQGGGVDLRGPLIAIYSFPTVVIFCEGLGIATAKALVEATAGVGGLSFPLRKDVRMYYRVRAHCGSACSACPVVEGWIFLRNILPLSIPRRPQSALGPCAEATSGVRGLLQCA